MIIKLDALNMWGVLERFVRAFGDREDDHLGLFAKIEQRRADQVADVFHHDQRVGRWVELRECARQHLGFQMAARAGINLYRPASGGADALGVEQCFLITLDHTDRNGSGKVAQGVLQQGGFTGTQ